MNKVINIDYSKLSGDAAEMIREVSPETAKAAFGKNVQNVEIAWSSLCNHAGAGNKKCGSFCINCVADYATSAYGQFLFDRGLWERVASDIASTGYKGRFQCNRYNEPFAVGVDDLKFYIGTLRKYNPDCQIIFNTNGDFLTREKLDAARDAGLSSLNIQIYPSLGSGEAHSTETSRKYLEKYEEKFGLKAEPVMECSGIYDEYKLVYDGVDALVYAKNIPMLGCNRGEAVAVGRPAERRDPCLLPISSIAIDVGGTVYSCCNLTGEVPSHRDLCLGDVHDSAIYDIYAGAKSRDMMAKCAGSDFVAQCRNCNFYPHGKMREDIKLGSYGDVKLYEFGRLAEVVKGR